MTFTEAIEIVYSSDNPVEVRKAILSLREKNKPDAQRALALWACHYGFNELVPKRNEMVIPVELKEYREKKRTQPRFSLSPEFWVRDDISTYTDHDIFVERENISNRDWLKQVLSWLTDEDTDLKLMVEGRIREFDGYLDTYKSPEAERVREAFSGSVV